MKNNGFSYFLKVTTEKYLKATFALLFLNVGLFLMLPSPFWEVKSFILKFAMLLFLGNSLFRVLVFRYFQKNHEKIIWEFQDKVFQKFFAVIIITGIFSSLCFGLMTIGSIMEYGQNNLFTSILMICSGAMILIGANNFSFTKTTVVIFIACIFLPVLIYMVAKLDYSMVGYWLLLIVFGVMSVNQVFSSREMMLKNIEMSHFYQTQVEYYKSILESVPGLVTIFNSNLEYEMINSRVSEFTGFSDKELIGKRLGSKSGNNKLEKIVLEFKNSYLNFTQTKTKIAGAHEERWFMIALHKIKTTGQIAVVSIDIDAQVIAEEKSLDQRAMVESSARMAAIGQLAAGIAHEINNPLAVITSKSEQLLRRLKDSKDEKNIYDLSKIQSTAFRIANIVKGLKSLSRDGDRDPFTEVSVEDLLKDISVLFEEKLRTFQIELIKNIPENLKLECRPTQISQVIMNLISNSIDAIQNHEKRWICVEAQMIQQSILISVTDSGNGIPNEVLTKLMTPFFTTKPAGVGTGLGLSISKRIVTDHHGQFYYDHSSANTRFVLLIPEKHGQLKKVSA